MTDDFHIAFENRPGARDVETRRLSIRWLDRSLLGWYEDMAEQYSWDAVQEAALARQGEGSTEALQHAIDAAKNSRVTLRPPQAVAGQPPRHRSGVIRTDGGSRVVDDPGSSGAARQRMPH